MGREDCEIPRRVGAIPDRLAGELAKMDKAAYPDDAVFGYEPMQKLRLEACRAAMADDGHFHPMLGNVKFGDMTEAQLRELIAWHKANA